MPHKSQAGLFSYLSSFASMTTSRGYRVSGIPIVVFLLCTASFWFLWPTPPPPPFPSYAPQPGQYQCTSAGGGNGSTSPVAHTDINTVIELLPLRDAESLCSTQNLPVFQPRDARRKVYDLIPINTELEWLEIRLNELDDQVDYFVILESMQTFTGHAKPLIFKENYACFAKFHHKIIYHALDMTEGNFHDPWSRESYSRNALLTHVFPSLLPPQAPSTKDVLIIADIDEIPRPETLEVLRNCDFPQRTTLRSRFFYYSYQWQHRGKEWEHPQATYFLGSETVMPQDLRKRRGGTYWDFWNSSWHCSSCFATVAEMDYKIASFSHKEFNRAEFRDPDGIVRRVRNGLDLFDRWGENYERVDPVTDVPHWLMEDENKSRFEFLLSRDSDNAGFRDYP